MSSPTPSGPPPDTPRRDDGRGKLAEVFTDDEEQSLAFCRVCWAPDDSAALLSPCLCSGGLVLRAAPPPHRPGSLCRRRRTGCRRWRPSSALCKRLHIPSCVGPMHALQHSHQIPSDEGAPNLRVPGSTSFACHLLSGTILPRPLRLPSFSIRLQAPRSMYTSNACGGGRRACRSGTALTVRAAATSARSCRLLHPSPVERLGRWLRGPHSCSFFALRCAEDYRSCAE